MASQQVMVSSGTKHPGWNCMTGEGSQTPHQEATAKDPTNYQERVKRATHPPCKYQGLRQQASEQLPKISP